MMGRHELTRLEAFSDAVFAFALTLLVVSLEVPDGVSDLLNLARGSVPFALTFAMICWIWYQHQQFFTRYDPRGAWVAALNCTLLFVVLFYVYPLKFMTVRLVGPLVGLTDPKTGAAYRGLESDSVMLLYSAGVVLIFGVFLALHHHVWRQRDALPLDAEARTLLAGSIRSHAISAGLGVVSIAITLVCRAVGNSSLLAAAGLIYLLMGPLQAWNGYVGGKRLAEIQKGPATRAKR